MLHPQIEVIEVGFPKQPIIVIDNFHVDIDSIIQCAKNAIFYPAINYYPGIRGNLCDEYWTHDQVMLCQKAITRAFNMSGKIELLDASFSMVTTQPECLDPRQSLPHCDAYQPRHIALVHYLSPDFPGGTAFFRHRSTGLQTVSEQDRAAYFEALQSELDRDGPPPRAYIRGDTKLFEQIHEVEGRFNRAVLYRGQQLHSGVVEPSARLSADPSTGRLTVTAFMTLR
jgi:hypothetical protein